MSCVIPGCENNQKNSKGLFFARCRDPWKEIVKKYRNDPLPKKALICEDHFSPECFIKKKKGRYKFLYFLFFYFFQHYF